MARTLAAQAEQVKVRRLQCGASELAGRAAFYRPDKNAREINSPAEQAKTPRPNRCFPGGHDARLSSPLKK